MKIKINVMLVAATVGSLLFAAVVKVEDEKASQLISAIKGAGAGSYVSMKAGTTTQWLTDVSCRFVVSTKQASCSFDDKRSRPEARRVAGPSAPATTRMRARSIWRWETPSLSCV